MNYIQQAYQVLHDSWRYLVGIIIIFAFWQIIGIIPLMIFVGIEIANGAGIGMMADISQMASLLGNNLFLFLMLFSFAAGLVGILLTTRLLH